MMRELRIIKKLLVADMYANDVPSDSLSRITGMDAGDIRKLVSKRKSKVKKNA